ncbi:hypothetical protein AAF712_014504 [Marasmius tenuissimus]|uniref:Peptidase metallopeptidase domain-containing protein n=1 Tax=Marasmius tenuissimus TaxID=585030 RepID=A0ABR2ZEE3_9AGAR
MVICITDTIHAFPRPNNVERTKPSVVSSNRLDASSLALLKSTRWPGNGARLDVACINDPPIADNLLEEFVKLVNVWSNFCNCRFILLPIDPSGHNEHIAAADVRIRFSFHSDDSWSYVGTRILEHTNCQEPTMMIGVPGNHVDLSDSRLITTLQHEAGHTLGFIHEHLRPELVKRIDETKAIAYYESKFGWTAEQTKSEVLLLLSPTSGYDFSSEPDIHSIMCYVIPRHILKDGSEVISGGKELSEYDKKHAAAVYPIPKYEKKVMKKGEVDMSTIASKDLYLLMRNGVVVGCFEFDQQRECILPSNNPRFDLMSPPVGERTIIPRPIPVTQATIVSLALDGQLHVVKNSPTDTTRQEGLKGSIDKWIFDNEKPSIPITFDKYGDITAYEWQGTFNDLYTRTT